MGIDTNIYIKAFNIYGSQTIQELEYNKNYSTYKKEYKFPDILPFQLASLYLSNRNIR